MKQAHSATPPMQAPVQWVPGETARPQWLRTRPWAPWAAVGAVCLGAFMGQLDASIVTLTYPALEREFHTSLGTIQWVSLSYLLVLATLLVPVGRWSDARGRKLLYLHGFTLFTLASAACAFAPSLQLLIAFRALQAVGAALLQANSIALVTLSVPAAKRRAAFGVQAAAQALGLALGPTVGGVLVEHWGWRSVFWINIPVGVVAIACGRMLLPRSRHLSSASTPDRAGFVLIGVAATAGLLALSGISGMPMAGWVVLALGVAAVVAVTLLTRVERRAAAPLLDPKILALPGVSAGLARAFAGYLVLFAPLVLFPTVFDRWGLSAAAGGLLLSCLPAGFAAAAVAGNMLPHHISNELRLAVGGFLSAGALAALVFSWSVPALAGLLLIAVGAGLGLAIPANNAAVMSGVPRSMAAVTGGQVNVARALGTSLGVALTAFGIHVAARLDIAGPPLVLAVLAVTAVAMAGRGRTAGGHASPPTTPSSGADLAVEL